MDIEVRRCTSSDEQYDAFVTGEIAFGAGLHTEDAEELKRVIPVDRTIVAVDSGAVVGAGAAMAFELTIPGGTSRAAGVTLVGVLPTHRRRGILRRMMDALHADALDRQEPLAVLWASEANIYQRFGYGRGARGLWIQAEKDRMEFLEPKDAAGRVRLVSVEDATKILPGIYDRVRSVTPGMFSRSDDWWTWHTLRDSEHRREGAGPTFRAVVEIDGSAEAYALYRVKDDWDATPKGKLKVLEVMATSPAAAREVWRFLFGIDLIERIDASDLAIDDPLPLMITEPRYLRAEVHDALWVRILDVGAALEARSYAANGHVTIALTDDQFAGNSGTWIVETSGSRARVTKATRDGDITMHVRDLGALYLGDATMHQLLRAGRGVENTLGAAARLDDMFATRIAPWCPEIF